MLKLWEAVLFDVGALLVVVMLGSSLLIDHSFDESDIPHVSSKKISEFEKMKLSTNNSTQSKSLFFSTDPTYRSLSTNDIRTINNDDELLHPKTRLSSHDL
jgi:hypothetical protein